ncbi:MAG: hemolysin III family protein [Bacteroidales bacterium]|nr:hemolysin III family protein [Bacteroidales bacterium]
MQKKDARQEEFANAVTHGAGILAGVVSLVVLCVAAFYAGNAWYTFSVVVFGFSLILLYGCSCCYHACRDEKMKRFLRKLDHSAIFILIAGTYTPFTLVTLRQSGNWGWPLFILIWSAAIFGIILSFSVMKKSSNLKTICYLVMGWSVLLVVHPLIEALSAAGHMDAFYWLLAGGAFYTFGTVFFFLDSYRYMHPLWHLFVLGGSLCHVVSVYELV